MLKLVDPTCLPKKKIEIILIDLIVQIHSIGYYTYKKPNKIHFSNEASKFPF